MQEEIVIDRKTMEKIIKFIEEAVREGLSKEEIIDQIDLMLDKDTQNQLEESFKDIR